MSSYPRHAVPQRVGPVVRGIGDSSSGQSGHMCEPCMQVTGKAHARSCLQPMGWPRTASVLVSALSMTRSPTPVTAGNVEEVKTSSLTAQ